MTIRHFDVVFINLLFVTAVGSRAIPGTAGDQLRNDEVTRLSPPAPARLSGASSLGRIDFNYLGLFWP